ncbi:hypothetical protein AVEN_213662-1, partial [Araneus ventricosus]
FLRSLSWMIETLTAFVVARCDSAERCDIQDSDVQSPSCYFISVTLTINDHRS